MTRCTTRLLNDRKKKNDSKNKDRKENFIDLQNISSNQLTMEREMVFQRTNFETKSRHEYEAEMYSLYRLFDVLLSSFLNKKKAKSTDVICRSTQFII